MTAPFGHPGSVTGEALARLPAAMQREGALLLAEMGMDAAVICRVSGWHRRTLSALLRDGRLFRHETTTFKGAENDGPL